MFPWFRGLIGRKIRNFRSKKPFVSGKSRFDQLVGGEFDSLVAGSDGLTVCECSIRLA